MKPWFHLMLVIGLTAGCDDASTARLDASVGDSTVDALQVDPDAAAPDARVVMDSAPLDAALDETGMDSQLPDLTVDAEPDMRRPDMGVLRPDACVGSPPPEPQVSPDGSEVCNYVDDDGDGLVDEGYEYGLISDWIAVADEPAFYYNPTLEIRDRARTIGWLANDRITITNVDERLCPVQPQLSFRSLEPGGPDLVSPTHQMKFATNGRSVATITSHIVGPIHRPQDQGQRLVLTIASDALVLGEALQIATEETRPLFSLSQIVAVDEGFAILVTSENGSRVFEVHPPDWTPSDWVEVEIPHHPLSMSRILPVDEGFRMLVSNHDAEARLIVTSLVRFDRSWRTTILRVGPGAAFPGLGPLPDAHDLLYPAKGFTFGFGVQQLWLARVGPRGQYADGFPAMLHEHTSTAEVSLSSFIAFGGQQIYTGAIRGTGQEPSVIRAVGAEIVQHSYENIPHRIAFDIDPRSGMVAQSSRRVLRVETGPGLPDQWQSVPALARFGCREED